MESKLPLYQLSIDPDAGSDLEVSVVALVGMPAIERDFQYFNEVKPLHFASVNDEQRIVVGPAMVPDFPIYRRDDNGEYLVTFTKETVKQIAEKFYHKGFQNNANMMHDAAQTSDGVCYFLSFLRDTEKGLIGLAGEYPEGTWFLGAKINDDAVWEKVKAGEIKGFSVEGLFKYTREEEALSPEDAYAAIEKILEKVNW